jgi:hypothetical protein
MASKREGTLVLGQHDDSDLSNGTHSVSPTVINLF